MRCQSCLVMFKRHNVTKWFVVRIALTILLDFRHYSYLLSTICQHQHRFFTLAKGVNNLPEIDGEAQCNSICNLVARSKSFGKWIMVTRIFMQISFTLQRPVGEHKAFLFASLICSLFLSSTHARVISINLVCITVPNYNRFGSYQRLSGGQNCTNRHSQ